MKIISSMKTVGMLAQARGGADRLKDAIRRAIIRLSIKIQTSVKTDKLTGQVLHVRTGTLRRSINRKIIETPRSIIGVVGTNVKYAGVHEYGFNGIENVRAHTRKLKGGGIANVRQYTRTMNMPERSFLRSTLSEYKDEIQSDLRKAVISGLTTQPGTTIAP